MTELDAERRDQMAEALAGAVNISDRRTCDVQRVDALVPLVAAWLADAWDAGKWAAYTAEREGMDGAEVSNPYRGGDDG